MQTYRYRHGDRPLEGYTIQRAVGRGGFGEVYYALSDSGREVALKVILGGEQIELRGVAQCMNLKNPHLVTIFDVRHNEDGTPFVIMEYVAGPSLRELIDESPAGLGPQKAAFFLREIAKGLDYLHDRGIVHRDLKPGNIFFEEGYVKIGDYGLSKAITPSRHSGQTITVGTVHYMAPEVGRGRYDRSIDIYALGVVLYEMLTGQVPFLGSSHAEILMKHLTEEPDLSGIGEPFASTICRAMAKDPAERFQTVQEMVEAVFGAAYVRESVSCFRPESLSVAAGRVARKVAVGVPGSSAEHTGAGLGRGAGSARPRRDGVEGGVGPFEERISRWGERLGQRVGRLGEELGRRMGRLSEEVGRRITGRMAEGTCGARVTPAGDATDLADPARDPLNWNQRRLLGIATAAMLAAGSAFLAGYPLADPVTVTLFAFCAITGMGGGLVICGVRLLPSLIHEGPVLQRLASAGLATAFGLLCCLGYLATAGPPPWDDRSEEAAALLVPVLGVATLFTLAAARKRRGRGPRAFQDEAGRLIWVLPVTAAMMLPYAGAVRVPPGHAAELLGMTLLAAAAPLLVTGPARMVWAGRRERLSLGPTLLAGLCAAVAGWLFGGAALLAAGIAAGVGLVAQITAPFDPLAHRRRSDGQGWLDEDDFEPSGRRVRAQGTTHIGDRRNPAAGPVEWAAASLGRAGGRERAGAAHAAEVLWPEASPAIQGHFSLPEGVSDRKRLWALLLSMGALFWLCGLQRFYAGKVVTGVIWLCTLGLGYVGQIWDIVMIALGKFRDHQGRRLLIWHDPRELWHSGAPLPGAPAARPTPEAAVTSGPESPVFGPSAPARGRWQAEPGGDGSVSSRRAGPGRTDVLLAVPAAMLMLAGFLIAVVFVSLDLPEIIRAMPGQDLARQLDEFFGDRHWPRLLQRLAGALSICALGLGATLAMLARRRSGGMHVLRALLGAGGLLLTVNTLSSTLAGVDWPTVLALLDRGRRGPALEMFMDQSRGDSAVIALWLFVISMLLLCWPGRPARFGKGER